MIDVASQIVLRVISDANYSTKGAELTWQELDTNLKVLADAVRELQGGTVLTPNVSGNAASADVDQGNIIRIALTQNLNVLTLSNFDEGDQITLVLVQDATGGRSFTFPAAWKIDNGTTINQSPNAVTVIDVVHTGAEIVAKNKIGGGGTGGTTTAGISLSYTFDDGVADSDPGSEHFRLDDADPQQTGFVYISKTSGNGSAAALIGGLDDLSQIIYQRSDNVDTYQIFDVTGVPIDATNYFKIPVDWVAGGGTTLTDEDAVSILLGVGGITKPSVEYASIAAMISDQSQQKEGYFYAVGNVLYEKLASNTGGITDYKARAFSNLQTLFDNSPTDNPNLNIGSNNLVINNGKSDDTELGLYLGDSYNGGGINFPFNGRFNIQDTGNPAPTQGIEMDFTGGDQRISFKLLPDFLTVSAASGVFVNKYTISNAQNLIYKQVLDAYIIAAGVYTYSHQTTTSKSDPGGGYERVNNSSFSSVTEMYIDDRSDSGLDISTVIEGLQVDDEFTQVIYNKSGAGSFIQLTWKVTGDPVDESGYYTIPVTLLSRIGGTDNNNVSGNGAIRFGIIGSVGGGGLADAPSDGELYGRQDAAWTAIIQPPTAAEATGPQVWDPDLQIWVPLNDLVGGGVEQSFIATFADYPDGTTFSGSPLASDNQASVEGGLIKFYLPNSSDSEERKRAEIRMTRIFTFEAP